MLWCKRSLVATVPITFMVLLPEERTFFLLSLFILLSGLSVGTLFYPVFVQVLNPSSGMRKFKLAGFFLMAATFLSAEFTALFVSRQDVMTSAVFFHIKNVRMKIDQNHPTIKPGIQINRAKRPRRIVLFFIR